MVTKHLPIVNAGSDDESVWRRLKVVPFDVVIGADEEDHGLDAKLAAEADGILRWLLDGHKEWLGLGLADPARVRAATDTYRDDEDAVGRFLDDNVTVAPALSIQSSVLFAKWQDWCKQEGIEPGSNKAFTDRLVNRGFKPPQKSNGLMVWRGVGLHGVIS
jgi:putative DNA primase/helicase